MTLFRKLMLSTAAAATLAGAASPAMARPWGWGGPRYYGHYHRGGDAGGALIGGLIIGGIIGAVAASADRRDRGYDRRDAPPSAEDRAAEACAAAVEADRGGRVNRISDVRWLDDAWDVEGYVDGGDPDGPGFGRPDSFRCTWRFGKVEDVRYGSDYRPRG